MTKNRITRDVNGYSVFASAVALIDDTVSFDQGDLIYLKSNKLAKQTTGDTGASFLGIAPVKIVDGKYAPVYNTDVVASASHDDIPGPRSNVIAKLLAKTGDAFVPGCKVYPDPATGTYGVSTTAGSLVAIGLYQGPTIASAVAGQEVEIFIKQTLI